MMLTPVVAASIDYSILRKVMAGQLVVRYYLCLLQKWLLNYLKTILAYFVSLFSLSIIRQS